MESNLILQEEATEIVIRHFFIDIMSRNCRMLNLHETTAVLLHPQIPRNSYGEILYVKISFFHLGTSR